MGFWPGEISYKHHVQFDSSLSSTQYHLLLRVLLSLQVQLILQPATEQEL